MMYDSLTYSVKMDLPLTKAESIRKNSDEEL